MRNLLPVIIVYLSSLSLFSQERLILKDNAFIVLQGSAVLVLGNSDTNAITIQGSGANIISEEENNRVKWNIGTSTGTYNIPFSKSAGNKIPLILSVETGGEANGSIWFSTFGGATWDNTTFLPSDVNSFESSCCTNNSANVIDRFWIIDPVNYTTKPEVSITFTYLDAEHTAPSNTIDESTLFAQRYNPTFPDSWGDWMGEIGTTNITANTVSSGTVSANNFYKSWTLTASMSPLPIEILYFNATCFDSHSRNFEWATATEENNSYFTIESSPDAQNWESITTLPGKASNSASTQKYSFLYYDKTGSSNNTASLFFRLKQTDLDGKHSYSAIIYNDCANTISDQAKVFPNPTNGEFTFNCSGVFEYDELIEIHINDVLGRLVESRIINNEKQYCQEYFDLSNEPVGVYYLTAKSKGNTLVKKIIHQ
ncbi:MAG: T9SS type A sorting domain-containing protein [Bacteroidota bacterium]|nr:T9SS type A sorting domain-containing protein [Bacteroidota bacterium]